MTVDSSSPPAWAEWVLLASLQSRDAETVTGDLLEEYRTHIAPSRGRRRADLWYATHALGFAWRRAGASVVLLTLAFLIRTAIDWRMPTADFHLRSEVSTFVSVGVFLLAGFQAGARSGSSPLGGIAGLIVALFALPLQLVGAAVLLAIWNDHATLAAIQASGGLGEVFSMPLMTVLPAAALGVIGGAAGAASRRLHPA